MTLPQQGDLPDRDSPAASPGQYFVSPPRRGRAVALILVLAAVLAVLWVLIERQAGRAHGTDARVAPAPVVAQQPALPPAGATTAPDRGAAPTVDVSALRGNGLTVAEHIARVGTGKCELNDAAAGPLSLRLSEYDGDLRITPLDALLMLRFAGLDVEMASAGGTLTVHPPHSGERVWDWLTANVDADGVEWGALRPWHSFRIASARPLATMLADTQAAPSTEALFALAWAVSGTSRVVRVGEDGRIKIQAGGTPAIAAEVQATRELFIRCAGSTQPDVRAAAADGLGEILKLDSHAQLPADDPLVVALGKLMQDTDLEVANSAALAGGQSTSVSTLSLLTNCLLDWRDKPAELAVALVALKHAEFLGRRLDKSVLGEESWERRRAFFQAVRAWLASERSNSQAPTGGLRFVAAWLRAAEVFRPQMEGPEYAAHLQDRLWQNREPRGKLVALDLDRTGRLAASPSLPTQVELALVAGPIWWRNRFTLEQARVMLDSGDRRRIQAALWRLARPETRGQETNPTDEAILAVALKVQDAAQDAASPILRSLAFDALYKQHQRKIADGANEPWRLRWEADLALKAFLEDADAGVQYVTAGALGSLAGPVEMNTLTQADLKTRTPAALEHLLSTLTQRWLAPNGQVDFLTAATMSLAERFLTSENEEIAARAAWLRMHQPELNPEAQIRLLGLFKTPVTRASAIRALGAGHIKIELTAKVVTHLLADASPAVRQAVFDARLPRLVAPASDRAILYTKGISDPDAAVRLAALNALGLSVVQEYPALTDELNVLAVKDPDPEVRDAAARMVQGKR